MKRRTTPICALAGALALLATPAAHALTQTKTLERHATMKGAGCEQPGSVAVTLPEGARSVEPLSPTTGQELKNEAGITVATVVGVTVSDEQVTWGATGSGFACSDPAYYGDAWETAQLPYTLRYKVDEDVYVPRTCGASRGIAPSRVMFGCDSSRRLVVSDLKWKRFGQASPTATGRAGSRRATVRLFDPRRCGDDELVYRTARVTVGRSTRTTTFDC